MTPDRNVTIYVVYIDIRRHGMSANERTIHLSHNLVKKSHYRSKYGHQHSIGSHKTVSYKQPKKMTSVKPCKREN